MNENKIIGVVVTYCPKIAPLNDLLLALRNQIDLVMVVDNGSPKDIKDWLSLRVDEFVHTAFLDENKGIAAAQNIGINWARERGAKYVLLHDQDSLPAPDMVARLLSALHDKSLTGVKIAAVGARYMDSRQNNPPPFIQIRGLRLSRHACTAASVVEVDYLIGSGSLIPISALDAVGPMLEKLFVDYVDIEWGLRAKEKGYGCYGVCEAKMKHDLGDSPIQFARKAFPARSPLRHYYMFRNATWLYFHTSLPLNWKLVDGWRLLSEIRVLFPFTPRPD